VALTIPLENQIQQVVIEDDFQTGTNMSIVLAGGLVLMVVGLYKQGINQGIAQFRRAGLLVFIVGILVISIPLAFTTYSGLMDLTDESYATLDVQTWLQDTTYVVESLEVNDNLVVATVDGSGELPDLQELANQLASLLNRPVTVDLRIIQAIMSNSSFP
jgi:5,10-methenyltetrahydromethanopterin hydrogenase